MDFPYRTLQRYLEHGDVHKEPVRWCSKEFGRLSDVMGQEKYNLLADIWKTELVLAHSFLNHNAICWNVAEHDSKAAVMSS
jgi:hypothetical protein